jgi:predicted RNase H-like nuclease (RuvC/YqgF family)
MSAAPTFTIAELVYEPMCSSLDPIDRALWISDSIQCAVALEDEVADLRERVAELEETEEEHRKCDDLYEEIEKECDEVKKERDRLKTDLAERDQTIADLEGRATNLDAAAASGAALDMLRDLVAAFEASRIGKMAKVGSLVVIAPGGSVAEALGALVAKAKALVSAEVAP